MRFCSADHALRFLGYVALCTLIFALMAPDARANPLYASLVIDADTGTVLHERHADKVLHPASLTKVMTLVMAFDAIERGQLSLRDRAVISRHAASMIPSKLDLPVGSSIRVEDAIYALVTRSANDVAVALGEKLGGTESQFAVMMTRKAREIGMRRTVFKNASGLHHPDQVTTARDMALLAQYVLRAYPQYYHYFSTRRFTYQGQTHRNHNRLMETFPGMDGFKTGYIRASGFNLIASATRHDRRIIGVVFGGRSGATRNAHMEMLMERGFAQLETVAVAMNAPPPPRKPEHIIQLAALAPAAGRTVARSWAELNPILQGRGFSAIIGEGDQDASETKRFETGMMAVAAVKGQPVSEMRMAMASQSPHRAARAAGSERPSQTARQNGVWAIQVGAFSSRVQTDHAIRQTMARLPREYAHVTPVIVPLQTAQGWVFRGRLSGFTREQAAHICANIQDCMLISPQAH